MAKQDQTEVNSGIRRERAATLATAAMAAVVVLCVCRPTTAMTSADDPTAPVVTAAAWAAWGLAIWLLVGVAAAAAANLPRRSGALTVAARRLAPVAVRRLVDAGVGATAVALAVAAPATAHADPGPTPAAINSPNVDRPNLDWPNLDWPGLAVHPAPARRRSGMAPATPARPAHASGRVVVVRPGDTLWQVAARQLGPAATDAEVAAEWPRLFAANRAVIGPDPDLIRPGQRLVLPTPDSRSDR